MHNINKDITNRSDISRIISVFYSSLMKDPIVKHFFTEVRKINLDDHIPVIVDFWENILFQTGAYKANAMAKHFQLNDDSPITGEHFERWLSLFNKAIDNNFQGEKAEQAKMRASQIARLMAHQMSHR